MPETTRHQGAFSAIVTGVADRVFSRRPVRSLSAFERLDGKNVLVTGASRGLGRAIAVGLGRLGATVHVPVRSLASETVAAVHAAGGRAKAWPLDLERLGTIDALVAHLAGAGIVLDRVVLNAGVVPQSSRQTPHGLDLMLQVNALANVYLIDRLLETGVLRPAEPAPRVIIVGSEAHRSSPPRDWSTYDQPEDYGTGGVLKRYGQSKLVLHTWAMQLARRLDTPGPYIAVHHLCPGAIASNIAREAPAWSRPILDCLMGALFQSPERAAEPVLWLAAKPDVGVRTGLYLHVTTARAPAASVLDAADGEACWNAVHRTLARVHPKPTEPAR